MRTNVFSKKLLPICSKKRARLAFPLTALALPFSAGQEFDEFARSIGLDAVGLPVERQLAIYGIGPLFVN